MKKLLLLAAFFAAFGVKAQLRLVRDMRPNPTLSSNPASFFVYDGKLFFSANYSDGNRYVFSTDGTSSGTHYVRFDDPTTGTPAVNTFATTLFYQYNNDLYFDARVNSSANIQIVKLSGADNAVNSIFDLTNYTATQGSRFTETIGFNNKLLFNPLANIAGNNPVVLDLVNPSNSGQLYPIFNSSNPQEFTMLGNYCFFAASNPANGRELWKTDGTNAGTSLYLDLNPGTGSGDIKSLNALGAQLTFVGTHATLGEELFRTNGAGSLTLLKDINPTGSSSPSSVTVVGNLLYFGANNGTIGRELWTSAGTTLSTVLLKDINPSGDSNPSKFKQVGSWIYFIADDGVNGIELWKTDGTGAGTSLVKNINPTGSSNPDFFTEYNGKLFFVANNGVNGAELWSSDGTEAGTNLVVDVFPGATGSTLSGLTVFGDELYFGATASSSIGQEIYAYRDPVLSVGAITAVKLALAIAPNPATDYFECVGPKNIEKVEVYSILGQLVKSFTPQAQYSVSDLKKGVYQVKITASGKAYCQQLLVD